MQISNINNSQINSFTGATHRRLQQGHKINNLECVNNPYVVYSCENLDDDKFSASYEIENRKNNQNNDKQNDVMRFVSAVLTALAVGGALGYSAGEDKGKEKGYIEGYAAGVEYAQSQTEEEKYISPFSEDYVVPERTPAPTAVPYEYTESAVELTGIPESVLALAENSGSTQKLTELDFSKEVQLYNADAKLPSWLVNTKADREVVRQAQYNLARVFQSGNNIFIYLKQDTTMGDIKGVYGILDGVLGNYPENKMTTRPQTGTTGNYDNAIVKAGETIKLEKVTSKEGNTIFRYAAHNSDKSHQKTIAIIQKYADDKFSYSK